MNPVEIKKLISAEFPDAIVENESLQEYQIELKPESWLEIAKYLRTEPKLSFDQLECITGVDLGEDQVLQSRYNFHSLKLRHKLEIIISLDRKKPKLASIEQIWRLGDWFEREIYDMYGIVFEGHRDLRRILLPEDWEGWPLRKNYETPETYHGIVVPKIKAESEWE
ncbi:MAG: NADH-quinone oxidoreductase subunit C [Candidatus Neomarinimicrobiota bacterium]